MSPDRSWCCVRRDAPLYLMHIRMCMLLARSPRKLTAWCGLQNFLYGFISDTLLAPYILPGV